MIGLRDRPSWVVLAAMSREEWRLHADLFGGRRFGAFPLLIGVMAAVGGWLLSVLGTPPATLLAGAHAIAFVFGLHVGTVGLVGHDSLESLLGEVTLLLSSSRTLPLAPRSLLGIFLLKDVLYYAAMVLLPAIAGLALTTGLGWGQAALAVGTLTGMMALGFGVVFTMIALRTRRRIGTPALLAAGLAGAVAWVAGVNLIAYTPYAIGAEWLGVVTNSPATAVVDLGRALVPTATLVLTGIRLYDPTYRAPTRTHAASFDRWRRRLRDRDGLVTKTLFDVARSGGGLFKVPFSAGIVLVVAVGTVEFVGVLTGRPPAAGVTLGTLLGLTAFTTYNWLTQFDDPTSYRSYPVGVEAVLTAKYRAFLLLGLPVALGAYAATLLWYRPPSVDAVAGGVLMLGLKGYLFGLTVYLTGLEPAELLFDTVLFAAFTVGVAAALVPILIVGLTLGPLTGITGTVLVGVGIGLGLVGVALADRARRRWSRRYRLRG